MTMNIPRAFRVEVKIGAESTDELSALLHKLATHVESITEDLERLRITGVVGPEGSELKVVKSPIETVMDLGGEDDA